MRALVVTIISVVAVSTSAFPQQPTTIKVPPNAVDSGGGDFGLGSATTSSPPSVFSAALASLGSSLSTIVFGEKPNYGDLAAKIAGSNSSDINTMVCTTFDPKSPFYSILSSYAGVPAAPGETCGRDYSGGSGPYKANLTTDPSLPDRTIYAPIVPPPSDVKLPVIVWGGCTAAGSMFANFLTEIASYGFIAIATGPPVGILRATVVSDITKNIDWVTTHPSVKNYGNVDTSFLVVGGQSCGGLEAMSASYKDPRVKMTLMFNSGITDNAKKAKLRELKAPVAYFLGGPKDIAYTNGESDYNQMPANIPTLMASIDVGHLGSYYVKGGGRIGKAAVAFLQWQQKGDMSKRELFCNPKADSMLIKDGWNVTARNGMC